MEVSILPVTPFQQNCSLLVCERTRKGAIVDPGGEVERLVAHAEERCDEVEKILLTHAHLDHAGGTAELARRLDVPIEGPHTEDQFWIDLLPEQAMQFGFPEAETFTPDRWFEDGDTVTVGETELAIRHCPGHTPGHQVLFLDLIETGPLVLSGDLYHFQLSREKRRVPTFNVDEEMTLDSMDRVEAFVTEVGATFWIEHNLELFQGLATAPAYYN